MSSDRPSYRNGQTDAQLRALLSGQAEIKADVKQLQGHVTKVDVGVAELRTVQATQGIDIETMKANMDGVIEDMAERRGEDGVVRATRRDWSKAKAGTIAGAVGAVIVFGLKALWGWVTSK